MEKKNIFIIAGILLLALIRLVAADWTPQSDIDLRNVYQIKNVTNITAQYYCNSVPVCYTISELVAAGAYYAGGVYIYKNASNYFILNETKLNTTIDDRDSDTTYSHLSNFTDDLGSRGYTSLSNFSNDPGYYNQSLINASELTHQGDGKLGILDSFINLLMDNRITKAFIKALGFYDNTEVYNKTETYNKSEVDANFTLYLLLTDQRFNETDLVNSINTTANIMNLGFYNKSEVDNNFSLYYTKTEVDNNLSLYLLLTDQRFNETTLINAVNTTTNIMGLGFYNKSEIDANFSLYYTKTEVDNNLSNYILTADEGDLNTNSTTWWAGISGFLAKWFYKSGNDLALNESQLNASIDARTISTTYNASGIITVSGTLDAGDLDSILVPEDDDTYNVSEAAGANPLIITINFTSVTSFDSIIGRVSYDGEVGHVMQLEIQRSDTGAWENYLDLTGTTDFINIYIPVFDPEQHVFGDGSVAIRFNHVQTGVPSHNFFIDYLATVEGWTALTTADHDGLGGRENADNHPWALPTNGSIRNASHIIVTNNVTASWFLGRLNWSWLQNIPSYVKSWTFKLNATDQRYNETDLVLSVNTTSNIQSLSFYNKSEIDTNFTLYLLLTDQRFNETDLINSLNTTGNIMSLGFYNKSEVDSNLSLYLLLTDQRFNETTIINSINTTSNIMALGFYNKSEVDANLSNYILSSELPLANKTTPYCGNITGAASDLCTLTAGAGNESFNESMGRVIWQEDIGSDCGAGDFAKGVDDDGTLDCDTPAGGGDITGVLTAGPYLFNGSATGSPTIRFNESFLNATIDDRDSDTTYTNGSGIILVGTEFNHSDTSSQASDDNSGNTFIQDIILDTFGHITSIVNAAVDFSSYVAIANLVGYVGNWSADKSDYYNKSEVDANLSLYRLDSWDNITGIPHATPSDGDTTHFSLADEIYDWIIGLSYIGAGDIVGLVGNWSADKSQYWNTSTDLDTVISADEINEANIEFDTACAAGSHYYLSGNDLACETDDDTTYTAGDALTLTGNDIDFDGGATPGGELGGADWANPTLDHDALDDQYYDSEGDLTGLLDDNYEPISAAHFDATTINITCFDAACNWYTNATDSCMYWPSGGKDCGAA